MTNATATKAIHPQIAVLRCFALQRPARAAKVLACTLLFSLNLREDVLVPLARVPRGPPTDHAEHWRPTVGLSRTSMFRPPARMWVGHRCALRSWKPWRPRAAGRS